MKPGKAKTLNKMTNSIMRIIIVCFKFNVTAFVNTNK